MYCFTKIRNTLTRVQCANTTFYLKLKEDGLTNEKSRFYVGHNHFEASQCPRVAGSAQDGERTRGAKARSNRDPGSKPMHRKVENAVKKRIRQTSDMVRIYDVN